MSASKPRESVEVRIEHSLNKNEEEFVVKRRNAVLQSLQEMQIQCGQNEVPNIALLGSGGGQRAMVGLLGSLDQLQKTGLLDCVLYLSGVSGSTWCMASLYKEPNWSTKLETVKDKIIQRLNGPGVSWTDRFSKLKKYYYGKDFFNLTDFWAMIVVAYVKEIDEHTLTDQWDQHSKDPFPIYTAIDKQCKQCEDGDPWFEITPHEAGYSHTGAFVETSSFGSQFESGCKIKNQPEIDMLYLQALCSSALADEEKVWDWIKVFVGRTREYEDFSGGLLTGGGKDPKDECYQVLLNLVNMNLAMLKGADPSDFDKDIRTKLTDLSGGQRQPIFQMKNLNAKITDKKAAKLYMEQYTNDVCNFLRSQFNSWPLDVCRSICRCLVQWIWGRNYNFLHNMTYPKVPAALLKSETREHIDTGLLLNSPYFSVLRKERDIDLIISLDFSDGDPFTTVKEAAETCKKLNIPFPEVNIANELSDRPKDFYVFKGQNTPTVIHIPLFNVVNCGDDIETWRNKYTTFRGPYNAEMITDLMEVAGRNIINNRVKLVEQIRAVTKAKWHQAMARQNPTL